MPAPVLKGSTHQYLFAQVYNAIVLQGGAPCFLAELLGANSTSHCDHQSLPVRTVLQLFWLSIGRRFCRIKSASKAISESLKFQNFLGEHVPTPPIWRDSRSWKPDPILSKVAYTRPVSPKDPKQDYLLHIISRGS